MYRRHKSAGASTLPRLFLSLLLIVLGVPAVALSTALPASAVEKVSTDEDGANDEPNQKDLTRFTVDYADAASGFIDVTFNWDDIDWSGENTGDGCFLFDTDGDLNANYAVCVTVNGSPADITSTTIYSCGDDRVDRCSSPVTVVTPTAGSVTECDVATSADDPFSAGSAYPADTKAVCTIDLDDVGGTGTAVLLNTCSYPSQQPNSDPSDCVLIPRDGFINIVKSATPDDETDFYFDVTESTGAVDDQRVSIEGSGSLLLPVTSEKTYAVAEDESVLPTGWELVSAVCNQGETPTSVDVQPGETVTCTFTNDFDLEPTATLTKTANPTTMAEPGGSVTWTVQINNTSPEGESIYLTQLVDTMFGGGAGFGDLLDWNVTGNTCYNAAADDSIEIAFGANSDPEFSCTFTADISPREPGANHRNVVTATLNDDDGNTVTPSPKDDALVTITNVNPTIDVVKDATPSAIDEPGAEVTFDVSVENESTFETLTLESLVDDTYGDLLNWNDADNGCYDSTPLTKTTIAPGATYACSFKADVTGDSGDVHTNVVTAEARDNDPGSTTATDFDSAMVTIGDVDPVVTTVKAADPLSVYEPGDVVTYSVSVSNTSTFEAVTLKSLIDTLVSGAAGPAFGDLLDPDNDLYDDPDDATDGNTCNDAWENDAEAVVSIAPESSFTCTFTVLIEGEADEWHTNKVTATVVDDGQDIVAPSDNVRVDVLDVLPDITVTKSADPTTVPETGGTVTYTVRVTNNETAESLTLTSLWDDKFGNTQGTGGLLTWTAAGNTCDTMSTTIAAGGFVECTFTGTVSGNAGTSHVNTVTGTAADNDGNSDTDDDSATVRILDVAPTITVLKTADKDSVLESGEAVVYTVRVTNTSQESVTLTDLADDKFGNLLDDAGNALISDSTCTDNTLILAGASYTCTFTATVGGAPGDHVNEVTATVIDDDQTTATAKDDETVEIVDVAPLINVVKSGPSSINEPGGVIGYSVSVTNNSFESVTLTSLVDNRFGDLFNDAGNALISGSTCLDNQTILPAGTYSCTFNASVTGNAGFSHTNVVTATAVDDDETEVTDTDDHTVTIANVLPSIDVTKVADVGSVPESGAVVTYTVSVRNNSSESVTLTTLFDNRFGDLLDDTGNVLISASTCADNTLIASGATYSCTFDATVAGDPGVAHVNVVTGIAFDDDGSSATDTGAATVGIDDVPPTIELTKEAEIASVPEPGAVVGFTVEILNTSFETVTLTSLVDDMYGDLLDPENDLVDENTCESGLILAGATYTCSFEAFVFGDGGEDHRNVITGTVTDNDGTTGEDDDDEVIGIDDVLPTVELTKTADVENVSAPGGVVTYTVTVENTAVEALTLIDLVDDKFGDLLDDAGNALISDSTCEDDTVIEIGETYACTFTAIVSGTGGDHTNVVTGTLVDNEGNEVAGVDDETVVINEVLGEEEERPPVKPRPPAILPDTGASDGLVEVLGLGALMMLLGTWVLLRGRHRTE